MNYQQRRQVLLWTAIGIGLLLISPAILLAGLIFFIVYMSFYIESFFREPCPARPWWHWHRWHTRGDGHVSVVIGDSNNPFSEGPECHQCGKQWYGGYESYVSYACESPPITKYEWKATGVKREAVRNQ